jgi:hypothetical protein
MFNHDIDAIYEDIKQRQTLSDKKYITLQVQKSYKSFKKGAFLHNLKSR